MADYLDALNRAQREAVVHDDRPLLIIAGAGSGKTNTLAHRVAHIIVRGADPRRILLLTFSRRAAAEMTARTQRILARAAATGANAIAAAQIGWSGTFHAVANRLLRLHAADVALDPVFTVLDRSDAADFIDVVRNDLGVAKSDRRFPKKATCLAIYSRVVNAQEPLAKTLDDSFPWCKEHADDLRRLFAAYVELKQRHHVLDYDDLLLYWLHLMQDDALAARARRARAPPLRPRPRRRIPGHQCAAGADPVAAAPRRTRRYRRRRRRAVDLLLSRRDRPQHPRLPAAVHAAGARRHARAKLPLDATDPRRRQRRHRARRRALHEESILRAPLRCATVPRQRRRRRRAGRLRRHARPRSARSRNAAQAPSRPVSRVAPLRRARDRAVPPQHPVRQIRRSQVPRGGPRQRRALRSALGREPPRPRRRLPRAAAAARRRSRQRAACRRRARGMGLLPRRVHPPRPACRHTRRLARYVRAARAPPRRRRMASANGPGPTLVPAALRAHLRPCAAARARPRPARADRNALPLARAIPLRAHARPAASHGRPRRPAAARRGLPHPVHDPFREGPGMGQRLHPERRRRLDPVRHVDRAPGPNRRRAPAPLRRDDARPRPTARHPPLRFFVRQQRRYGDTHVYAPRTRFIPDTLLSRFARVSHGTIAPSDIADPSPSAAIDIGARLRALWS